MKLTDAIKDFDFEGYLEEHFSRVYPTSKPYRVRTHCFMCDDEKTGHLYIHVPKKLIYCQKCNYDPKSLVAFISDLEGISKSSAIELITGFATAYREKTSVDDVVSSVVDSVDDVVTEFQYSPMTFDESFVGLLETTGIPSIDKYLSDARQYLHSRKVCDRKIEKYNIMYCYSGFYSGRIIVPCYYRRDLVTFVARELKPVSGRKYLNPTANKQGDFLYNYDNVLGDTVVVTEGVFDAISVEDNVVSSFGKSLSNRQVALLNRFDTVVFYWDNDAYDQVTRYSKRISGQVKVVLHDDGLDAGDRDYEENTRLINSAVPVGSVMHTLFRL